MSLCYIDTLELGRAAGFSRRHGINHTSGADHYSEI